jgi:hypothetical protein
VLTKIRTAPERADDSRNKQQGRATPRTESRAGILAGNEIRRQVQDASARDSISGALHRPGHGICAGFRRNGYGGSKPESKPVDSSQKKKERSPKELSGKSKKGKTSSTTIIGKIDFFIKINKVHTKHRCHPSFFFLLLK